jgi:hypothetical protein
MMIAKPSPKLCRSARPAAGRYRQADIGRQISAGLLISTPRPIRQALRLFSRFEDCSASSKNKVVGWDSGRMGTRQNWPFAGMEIAA